MPQYRFNGTIKAITFKDARVSVLLTDTTFLSNEGDWKQWVDWKLVEGGKYKKGEVWVSAFEQSTPEVYQACREIEKGAEVEVEIFKTEKGFLNINNISLKVPERDVNEDLRPPDMPDAPTGAAGEVPPEEPQPPWPPGATKEPSSTQRPKDSPEAQAEEMLESIAIDTKEYRIVFQACLKGLGASHLAKTYEELINMTERAVQRVFRGK